MGSGLSAEPAPSASDVPPAGLKSARKKKHQVSGWFQTPLFTPFLGPQPRLHIHRHPTQDDVVKVIDDLKGKCDDLEDELATSHDDNRVLRKRLDALTASQLHGAAGGVDETVEAPPEKWMLLDFLMQLCQSPGDLDDDELQQRETALTKALQYSALSPLRNVARKYGLNGSSDDEVSVSASTVDGSAPNGEALAGAVRDALFPEEDRQLLRDVCESEALAQLSMVHDELHGAKQAAEKWQAEGERLQARVTELEAQVEGERKCREEAEASVAEMSEREEAARGAAEAEAAAIEAAEEGGFPPADVMDEEAVGEEDESDAAEAEQEEAGEEQEEADRVEMEEDVQEGDEEEAAAEAEEEAEVEAEADDDFVDDVVSAPAAVEDITEGAGSDDEEEEEEEEAMPPPPPAAGKKAPKSPLVSSDTDSPNPEVSTPSP